MTLDSGHKTSENAYPRVWKIKAYFSIFEISHWMMKPFIITAQALKAASIPQKEMSRIVNNLNLIRSLSRVRDLNGALPKCHVSLESPTHFSHEEQTL